MTSSISDSVNNGFLIPEDTLVYKIGCSLPVIGVLMAHDIHKRLEDSFLPEIDPARATRFLELSNQFKIASLISSGSTVALAVAAVALGILMPTPTLITVVVLFAIMLFADVLSVTVDIPKNNVVIQDFKEHGIEPNNFF